MEILKNVVLVITAPATGWDEVKRSSIPTGRLLSSAFLPVLAVLAVSVFVPMLYNSELTLANTLMTAVIAFASYFVTFYLTAFLLGSIYPNMASTHGAADRLNDFIIYNMIYLVVLDIIKNVLPVAFAPLSFMMLYMPYIAYRGTSFLGVPESQVTRFSIISGTLILLLPAALTLILNSFIIR